MPKKKSKPSSNGASPITELAIIAPCAEVIESHQLRSRHIDFHCDDEMAETIAALYIGCRDSNATILTGKRGRKYNPPRGILSPSGAVKYLIQELMLERRRHATAQKESGKSEAS